MCAHVIGYFVYIAMSPVRHSNSFNKMHKGKISCVTAASCTGNFTIVLYSVQTPPVGYVLLLLF